VVLERPGGWFHGILDRFSRNWGQMVFPQDRSGRLPLNVKPGRAMRALGELLRNQDPDPFTLYDASLELLVRQFLVDHAVMMRLSQGKLDTFWWVQAGTGAREPMELHHSLRLWEQVLESP
jgi:hypothetical protein